MLGIEPGIEIGRDDLQAKNVQYHQFITPLRKGYVHSQLYIQKKRKLMTGRQKIEENHNGGTDIQKED